MPPPGTMDPRFLLLYPPSALQPEDGAKPDGSLGLLYLAGALRSHGYDVSVLDTTVGPPGASLQDTLYRIEKLPDGRVRVGMAIAEILDAVRDYDVIGVGNMFASQMLMVADLVAGIKTAYPEKLVAVGGANARHVAGHFLFPKAGGCGGAAAADLVFLSEAEGSILALGEQLRRGSRDFSDVPGVAFVKDGKTCLTPPGPIAQDLDELPVPAWDMLPLDKYWDVARPHGGGFNPVDRIRYGWLMTSRGCPYNCSFCHISSEGEGSITGNLKKLRLKSIPRVLEEFDVLQSLDVEYVFIEDDSLFAKKKRAIRIINEVASRKLKLSDVNGVNIVHLCRPEAGRLVADEALFEAMAAAGFRELGLPFESGSQRVIDKYATGKVNLAKTDTVSIIRLARKLGIKIRGNYIIGWPDETLDEIKETITLAKRHMDAGMDGVNLMLATPFPGTRLFHMAVKGGYLGADFDPADGITWMRPAMRNTRVPPDVLEFLSEVVWKLLNKPARISNVMEMSCLEIAG